MRRWNGWGDEAIEYPLPEPALSFLQARLGPAQAPEDAQLSSVLEQAPDSRLPVHGLVTTDALERLRHARGQSLPDWIQLHAGMIDSWPDGVAYPSDREQVRLLLDFAQEIGAHLIPYGGGTSVVGHINPLRGQSPVLTVDMSRMNRLLDLDPQSRMATFEAGVQGPQLESQLQERGFTLGHYPQSWEYSTLGGWIATRSSGQQSLYYGRIEQMLVGAELETPAGRWALPAHPASAAGPDLRHLILGCEGRLGLITRATVRIRPLPIQEVFLGAFFRDWEGGLEAARNMAQEKLRLSMVRLSDPEETETTLALSGHARLIDPLLSTLRLLGYGPQRCLMIYAITARPPDTSRLQRRAAEILRACGGLPVGGWPGRAWARSRFKAPYLRNTLWQHGYALDTLETALPWVRLEPARQKILHAIRSSFQDQETACLVFSHLSHLYEHGASLYITYLFPRQQTPESTLESWRLAKTAASQAIIDAGGTISHQHGVGLDHRDFLAPEKGAVGLAALQAALQACDPQGLLNPGKLLPKR